VIAELLVFVIAMLALLALVAGALWRASRDRNAAEERGERKAVKDSS
jgi:hypothetical protein